MFFSFQIRFEVVKRAYFSKFKNSFIKFSALFLIFLLAFFEYLFTFYFVFSKEMKKIRESYIWQSILMGTYFSSGQLVMLFAIITYLFTGHMLTAERIFVAVGYFHSFYSCIHFIAFFNFIRFFYCSKVYFQSALYDACRLPITLFVPFALRYLFETKISLRRIQEFLELEECEQLNEHENSNATMQCAAKSYFSQSHKEKNSIEVVKIFWEFFSLI